MVGVLRVGCAMWTNPAWPGRSIPRTTASGAELAAYSALLSAVEGNTTFYALPTKAVAQRWAEATPEHFRFMFKLPKTITHDRKLRNCADEVGTFFRTLDPCLPKMDPVAIQLPASFGPDSLNVLESFMRAAPTMVRYGVEVRHPDFFDGGAQERSLNDLLATFGADRIIFDSRAVFAGPRITPAEHEAFENKPRLPVRAVATSTTPIVRFIGQTNPDANPTFWEPWVQTVVRWLRDDRSPIVFIHTPDNAAAIDLSRQFYDEVRAYVPELAAQPDAPLVTEATLFNQ